MLVILFRHGPAGSSDPKRWPDDRLRPLTTKGEKRTRQAADGIARLLRDVPSKRVAVWTSPLVRADQTARHVAAALAAGKPHVVAALAPGGSMRGLLERLTEAAAEAKDDEFAIVLVGHEPDLGQLAGELGLDPPSPLPLKKSGACAILFEGAPRRRTGTLEWFLPPRILRALAKRGGRIEPADAASEAS